MLTFLADAGLLPPLHFSRHEFDRTLLHVAQTFTAGGSEIHFLTQSDRWSQVRASARARQSSSHVACDELRDSRVRVCDLLVHLLVHLRRVHILSFLSFPVPLILLE